MVTISLHVSPLKGGRDTSTLCDPESKCILEARACKVGPQCLANRVDEPKVEETK